MGKGSRESHGTERSPGRQEAPPPGATWWVTILALGALLVVSVLNLQASRETRKALDGRLAQVDQRIAQLSTKLDTVAAAAPRRTGPDPARVYTVKTDGAPAKGPATAAVTIAEFSDFQ